jgi:lipoate-protein ligase A
MTPLEAEPWRLIAGSGEGAADGAWQMALDEALLDRLARGAGRPGLRFYRFAPATLSLGRHQPLEAAADPAWCRSRGVDLVRRPTGGGAVLHEAGDLTYALVAPLGPPGPGAAVSEVSSAIARALQAGLARLGVDSEIVERGAGGRPRDAVACFARPSRHELLWRGRKLTGSAQLRRRRAVLQHGSLPLSLDPERQRRATGYRGELPAASIEEAAGRPVSFAELAGALADAFADELGRPLASGALEASELLETERLRADRYLDAAWTLEGRGRARWSS